MSKTLTGSRAVVSVDNQVVGIYESCTYGVNVSVEPIHILGAYGAKEIVATAYEAVTINCSGWRIVGSGAHTLPKVPRLQDLLNLGAVTISIRDRQDNSLIMAATGCVGTSYNTGVQAKMTSRVQVTYVGLKLTDESGDQNEAGAVELP